MTQLSILNYTEHKDHRHFQYRINALHDLHQQLDQRQYQDGGSVIRGTHCLPPYVCPMLAAFRWPSSKECACASWWRQAGSNPGSSVPSHTGLHNDPLLDSLRPRNSLPPPLVSM